MSVSSNGRGIEGSSFSQYGRHSGFWSAGRDRAIRHWHLEESLLRAPLTYGSGSTKKRRPWDEGSGAPRVARRGQRMKRQEPKTSCRREKNTAKAPPPRFLSSPDVYLQNAAHIQLMLLFSIWGLWIRAEEEG
ncbi:hypothetical protein CB1_000856006 [Camelus ferus]|nr:hypothetical protein CB1_000856006 [Camelus ferus]